MMKRTGAVMTFLILTGITPGAEADSTLKEELDKAFAVYNQQCPGASIAIARDGKLIYSEGFGLSNLDYGIPNTPDTVFDIGSMAKQFTAACIAILVQEGKLSLHDDVRTYVPEVPDYGHRITVDHLLHHTSGIRSYEILTALAGFHFSRSVPTATTELFDLLAAQQKLDFFPGEEYSYSNSNYFLLAVIVERVSGRALSHFAQERIFGPLGMEKTFFNVDKDQVIKNRAIGYVRRGSQYEMMHDFAQYPIGARGVNSTILDIIRWQQNLVDWKVGGADLRGLMLAPGKLNNGHPISYALGLEVKEYRGLKTIGHGGSTGSFHTYSLLFPDQKVAIVAMSNGGINSHELIIKAADLCLAGQFKSDPPAPADETGSEETKNGQQAADDPKTGSEEENSDPVDPTDYAGTYISQELLGVAYRLVVEDGQLICHSPLPRIGPLNPEAPLQHKKGDVFSLSILELRFHRENGEVRGFRLDTPRARDIRFVKR
jgi:CubicO group peptidase (beta-lactamase class C family)